MWYRIFEKILDSKPFQPTLYVSSMGGDHKKIDKTLSEEFTPFAFNIKPDGSNASSSAVEGGFQFTSKGKKDSSSLLLFSGHATIATTSTTTL